MTETLFFPCTMDGLPRHSGSAMIRCRWVAKYMDGAKVYDGQPDLPAQDVYVFQKVYRAKRARAWLDLLAARRDQEGSCMLAFDLCDPDFLDPGARRQLLEVLPLFDFATAPTAPLVDWLAERLPAYLVPDGIDPDAITKRRAFSDTDDPKVCWIGYERNVGALQPMARELEAMGVIPHMLLTRKPVSFDVFLEQLTQYDILLNPRPDVAPFCYKSDNKSLVAWAAGVAVAPTIGALRALLDPAKRKTALDRNVRRARTTGHVNRSADLWRMILREEGAL